MTLDDRKSLLKEHSICSKCCITMQQQWPCMEVHPHDQKKSAISTEGRDPNGNVTKSSCTEICGEIKAKICLFHLEPSAFPERGKRNVLQCC